MKIGDEDSNIIQFSYLPTPDIKEIYDKIISHPNFSTLLNANIQDA